MKTRLSLLCLAVFLTATNVADAQFPQAYPPGPAGAGLAGGPVGQSSFREVRGDLRTGLPGRMWFETNLADEGLGYEGSYLTLGGKRRLFEDFLDGRWLLEAQMHHSIEEDQGDFFTNIGIERVFSIPSAGADISIGAWYDYNDETEAEFSNAFHQVSISGAIKTQRWDLLGNGYFPVGDSEFTLGDPNATIAFGNVFANNFILSGIGVDAAQAGFDATLRWRPKQLAFANGAIDFGGYGYKSDLIDFFGGGRVRLTVQALRGAVVSAEVNHDDRFKTTGLVSLGWRFGANGGFGNEYAGLARDLEPTLRNDHIVRANNEAAFVVNPVTGSRYNVVHADNARGVAGRGDGTFENPYATLSEAQTASAEGDVIFVATGDGTVRNYQDGVELKRNQLLLGDGGTFTIPDAATGGSFALVTGGGAGPAISNPGEQEVVRLADNNTVAGININAAGSTYGINGEVVDSGRIEDVTASNAGHSGVRLFNTFGDWRFNDNNFNNNLGKGLFVDGVFNPASTFVLQNNTASNNILDGIRFENFDAATFIADGNTTSNNSRDGFVLQNFANTAVNGLNILNHTSNANSGVGLVVDAGNGKLNVFAPNIANNQSGGIHITNWVNNDPSEFVVIAGLGGTPGVVNGNGLGGSNVRIELNQPGLVQNTLITNLTVSNGGGIGVEGIATGIDTVLNIDFRDNVLIQGNNSNGIALAANDSGVVNTNIGNPDLATAPMLITNNASNGGDAISLTATGLAGQPAAEINAIIRNVAILNDQSFIQTTGGNLFQGTTGINIQSIDNAVVDVLAADSSIGSPALTTGLDVTTGVNINLANNGNELVNRVELDSLDLTVGFSAAVTGNAGTGVFINTSADTLSDIILSNSTIRPNGQPLTPAGPNNGVFGDTIGNSGVIVRANGAADFVFGDPLLFPPSLGSGLAGPGSFIAGNFVAADIASDGILDNLTRVLLKNNVIRDFTFDGVDIASSGDAQLLLDISGNQVVNNGAGLDNDTDNDNVFNEDLPLPGEPNITALTFFDGVNIDAFGDSTISARITGNSFRDNFERGLSINTFGDARINAIVANNGFLGNDRGEDGNILTPLLSNGGPQFDLDTAGFFDFEAINNEEFYFRAHESPVFVLQGNEGVMPGANGDLFDPTTGAIVPAMGAGIFIPGNDGIDIDGNPIPIGTAELNLVLTDNGFENGLDILDLSQPPGDLTLSLNGTNAAPGAGNFGQTQSSFGVVDQLISIEEFAFELRGFSPSK